MHFDRPDASFEFIVLYSSMTVHVNRSASVVTHKLIELNKTCMDAILKALSTIMNENRRNKVFTVIKQLKMREYSKDAYSSLHYFIHVIFISMFPRCLTSCILNIVDRQLTSRQNIMST